MLLHHDRLQKPSALKVLVALVIAALTLLLLAALWMCGKGDAPERRPPERKSDAAVSLAVVAGDTIYARDLQELFASRRFDAADSVARRRALAGLAIERVFAAAAHEAGVDSLPLVRVELRRHAAEARVDAWLRDRLAGRVSVDGRDIRDRFTMVLTEHELAAWTVTDSATADLIAGLSRAGSPFHRAGNFRRFGNAVHVADTVRWGELPAALDSALVGLGRGEIGGPARAAGRWWVLRLDDFHTLRKPSQAVFDELEPWIRETLELQRMRHHLPAFVAEQLAGASITVEPPLFDRTAQRLYERVAGAGGRLRLKEQLVTLPHRAARVSVPAGEFELADTLARVISRDWRFAWTVADALANLYVSPFPFPSAEDAHLFRDQLRDQLGRLLQFALLDAAAIRDGYSTRAEVVRDSARWADHVLAREYLLRRLRRAGHDTTARALFRARLEPEAHAEIDSLVSAWIGGHAIGLGFEDGEPDLDELELVSAPAARRRIFSSTRPVAPLPAGMPWADRFAD